MLEIKLLNPPLCVLCSFPCSDGAGSSLLRRWSLRDPYARSAAARGIRTRGCTAGWAGSARGMVAARRDVPPQGRRGSQRGGPEAGVAQERRTSGGELAAERERGRRGRRWAPGRNRPWGGPGGGRRAWSSGGRRAGLSASLIPAAAVPRRRSIVSDVFHLRVDLQRLQQRAAVPG